MRAINRSLLYLLDGKAKCSGDNFISETKSTRESRQIRRFLNANGRIKAFLDLRSYGGRVQLPWAYSYADKKLPRGYKKLRDLIETCGRRPANYTGASMAYPHRPKNSKFVKEGAGIEVSLTIEAPEVKDGEEGHGFIVPLKEIESAAAQTWKFIKKLAKTVLLPEQEEVILNTPNI